MPRSGRIRLETLPYANTEYLITAVTAAVKLYNRITAQNQPLHSAASRRLSAPIKPLQASYRTQMSVKGLKIRSVGRFPASLCSPNGRQSAALYGHLIAFIGDSPLTAAAPSHTQRPAAYDIPIVPETDRKCPPFHPSAKLRSYLSATVAVVRRKANPPSAALSATNYALSDEKT